MVTVQPFSSCVVVIVRPFASVADEVARVVPPPLLRELDDTLTDELDEAEDELADLAQDLLPELLPMLLVSRPSSPIRTTAQSSGMLIRSLGAAAPISRPTAAPRT
jgi:sensor domain CHASE-containing protein